MSITEINNNYSVDINNGFFTFIATGLSDNIIITLPDASNYDINGIYVFNKDPTYSVYIQPYSGSSIIGGNLLISQYGYINLYSFNNQWFRF